MLRVDPISLVVLIILFYMAMFTTYQHFDNKAGRQSGVQCLSLKKTKENTKESIEKQPVIGLGENDTEACPILKPQQINGAPLNEQKHALGYEN